MLIINKEKEDIQYIKDRMIKEALLDMDIFPKTKESRYLHDLEYFELLIVNDR